jgi:hypothetical protein
MPTNIHFFGTVATSKNIIAYGSHGSYMLTSDKGKNWNQFSMNKFGEIRKIVNYNDTLWGVIDVGFIIRSTNHGMIWETYKIQLNNGNVFVSLEIADNDIYIRSLQGILRFDKNINFLNSNSDSILKCTSFNYNDHQDSPNIYYYDYLHLSNGKLFLDSKYFDGIIFLTHDLNKLDSINLKEKIFITNPSQFGLYGIYEIENKTVFNLSGNLYCSDNSFSNWTYFYTDTNYMNRNDPKFSQKWGSYYLGSYSVFNNILYVPHSELNTDKYKHWMMKYNNQSGTLIKLNNPFENKYYSSRYMYWDFEGTAGYAFRDIGTFFEDSIIVKAGVCKSLLQTLDNCKTWNLVSNLNGQPRLILNDSTYYYINDEPFTNDINRTNNYGLTFLPTELALDTVHRYNDTEIDTVSYLSYFFKTTIFYIDEIGRGFCIGTKEDFSDPQKNNFAYTIDGGKRFKFLNVTNLDVGNETDPRIASNVVKINDKYMISLGTSKPLYHDSLFNRIYMIDTNFTNFRLLTYNTLLRIHHILASDLEHYIVLTTSQDKKDLFKFRFEIKETNDSGKTFTTINSIDQQLTLDQIYEHNKDTVFFSTFSPAYLYLYDRKRNVIDTLYKRGYDDSVKVMVISGKFYLVGNNLFLENTDRKDLTKWAESPWDFGRPTFESVIFKGNVAIAKLRDSLRQTNYYRIMPKKETKVNEEKVEIEYYNNHFYAGAPFPLPAETAVKTKISWDMSFDLVDAVKGVYNIYGEKIESKENIQINIFGKSSAELVWNCFNIPSGLYFILVHHNGISDCVPIIVGK